MITDNDIGKKIRAVIVNITGLDANAVDQLAQKAQQLISSVDAVIDIRATAQKAVLQSILDDIRAVNRQRAGNDQMPIRDDDNGIIKDILAKYGLVDDADTIDRFFDDYDKYTLIAH